MKAYELIDKPEKWTKRVCARNVDGNITSTTNDEAVCFCAFGAIIKAYQDETQWNKLDILDAYLKQHTQYIDIPLWNDDSTWQEVYNLLKELDI